MSSSSASSSSPTLPPAAHEGRLFSLSEDDMRVVRRFVGGTVGGVLQAASAHPFDTVKSRLQNGVFHTIAECMKSTWQHEGVYGFYRGVTPILALNGFYNSILFSLNQFMLNAITPADFDAAHMVHPLWRVAVAGQLTAPLYVLVMTPTEKVKVLLQVQGKGGERTEVTGPISCMKSIVRERGVMGLFSGYIPFVCTRLIGLPCYFVGYDLTKRNLATTSLATSNALFADVGIPLLSGTMAGFAFWCSNYPFDFIKTQVQASKAHVSTREVIRATYERGGLRAFYKGFSACLLRSIPANSSVWLGVELTNRAMISYNW